MNKTLNTILLVLGIVVLAGGIFFAGSIYARSNMMFGWGNNQYGFSMMNGGGMMGGFGFGGIFMFLLPLGLLVLIGLSIAYLWKKLNEKPVQQ